jgi:hypothetical protein
LLKQEVLPEKGWPMGWRMEAVEDERQQEKFGRTHEVREG